MDTPNTTHSRSRRALAGVTAVLMTVSACSLTATTEDSVSADASVEISGETVDGGIGAIQLTGSSSTATLWDSSTVHDIDIQFDEDEYLAAVVAYTETGDKEWISATVTIDGVTYQDVGLRLKGNSSLFSLNLETSGNPEDLPWLIRLDKYIDHQNHEGVYDIVIRSNSTETAMNEAVALELLGEAGLATEEAVATAFTINDGDTELRLAMELPADEWAESTFGDNDFVLYKAESTGDYSYRGDDPDSYDEVFDLEGGDDDMEPLIDFLEFINNTDDETFAAELADHLDVELFATYLAYQDLVSNGDDIDGRGNNSYLYYDRDADLMTVVNWDLNLAFGTANVGGAGGPGGFGDRPEGAPEGPPEGVREGGAGFAGPGAGGAGGTNVLSERFRSIDEFASMIDTATAELTESLYADGTANEILATWVEVLTSKAGGLVTADQVASEAGAIEAAFPASS
ncbi:MAG: hypothetical protein GY929_08150 [Actinomycetia bacterium]|nr:hypothetical protein [Actinomycetes bacterium]